MFNHAKLVHFLKPPTSEFKKNIEGGGIAGTAALCVNSTR